MLTNQVEYPTEPRQGMNPLTCHRFQSSAYRSNQWRYVTIDQSEAFIITIDQSGIGAGVTASSSAWTGGSSSAASACICYPIRGLHSNYWPITGMYGSSNGSADYTVRIQLKHNGKLMADNTASFQSDGSSNTYVTIDQSEPFIMTIDESGSMCSLTTRCRLRRTSPTQPQPSWMGPSSPTLDRYRHQPIRSLYCQNWPIRGIHLNIDQSEAFIITGGSERGGGEPGPAGHLHVPVQLRVN